MTIEWSDCRRKDMFAQQHNTTDRLTLKHIQI